MPNDIIRATAKASGVKLWEIAYRRGVTDSTFSRLLRRELPEQERARTLQIIAEIVKETQNAAKNENN